MKKNNADSFCSELGKESSLAIQLQNPTGAEMALDDHFKQEFSHKEMLPSVDKGACIPLSTEGSSNCEMLDRRYRAI